MKFWWYLFVVSLTVQTARSRWVITLQSHPTSFVPFHNSMRNNQNNMASLSSVGSEFSIALDFNVTKLGPDFMWFNPPVQYQTRNNGTSGLRVVPVRLHEHDIIIGLIVFILFVINLIRTIIKKTYYLWAIIFLSER